MRTIVVTYIALCAAATSAWAAEAEPRVPDGTNPRGVAIAILSTGLDYTRPFIAEHLARDGEGELVGWDLVDKDRRPYKAPDDLEGMGYEHRGTAVARIVLKRAPAARLVPVRLDPGDPSSVGQGLEFVAKTPARVAILTLTGSTAELWASVRDVMENASSNFLLVVAAGNSEDDNDRIKEHLAPSFAGSGNVLIVTACTRLGGPMDTGPEAETNADVAVNVEAFSGELIDRENFSWKPEGSIAAAEVAAMAARILKVDPDMEPERLKSAILAAAKPFEDNELRIAKHGWIAEPWRRFPAK